MKMLKAERICENCGKIFYVEDREQDVKKKIVIVFYVMYV